MKKLPISVISPVFNCRAECEAHAAYLNQIADLVEEVIVVDSHSEDGTTAHLQKLMHGENIQFLQHPRGLYQSWNFGVRAATQPYLTFATVGDELEPESLKYLLETIQEFDADVVISSPQVMVAGTPIDSIWPPGEIIHACDLKKPVVLSKALSALLMIVFHRGCLLGSSASNLYLTNCLKKHPFPVDYGHRGDAAWGFLFAKEIRWAIDPRARSIFNQVPVNSNATAATPTLIDNMTQTIRVYLNELKIIPSLSAIDPSFWNLAYTLIDLDNKLLKIKIHRSSQPKKSFSLAYAYHNCVYSITRKKIKKIGLDFTRKELG